MNPTQKLRDRYPEGIPAWMLERYTTEAEIIEAMELRRKAFPATKPKGKKSK